METRRSLYLVVLLVLFGVSAAAENLFVTPSGGGLKNGSDWNNAFQGIANVPWGAGANQLGPGDTLWIAGGNYAPFQIKGSGTSGNPIRIKRATVSNTECTSAAGWSLAFDSQVNVDCSGTVNGLTCAGNVQHYWTLDGQVQEGIRLIGSLNADSFTTLVAGNGIELANLKYAGNKDYGYRYTAQQLGWSSWGTFSNCVVRNVIVDGYTSGLYFSQLNNTTITNNQVLNNLRNATIHGYDAHPDAVYITGCFTGVYAYNTISNFQNVALYFTAAHSDGWKVYSNKIMQGPNVGDFGLSWDPDLDTTPHGSNWWVYGNTFNNIWAGVRCVFRSTNPQCLLGANIYNNIFYKCDMNTGSVPVKADYNWFTTADAFSAAEPHAVVGNNANPFTDSRLHIQSTVSSTMPRNKGLALSAEYALDFEGQTRGADGTWDIGADEYIVTATPQPPNTPTNVAPAASATGIALTPTLQATYSDPLGKALNAAEWQILANGIILWDYNSPGVTAVAVPAGILTNSTAYSWKVRQSNGDLWSAFSTPTTFTTLAAPQPPNTPSNSSPSNGATSVSLTPTLTTSYSDPASKAIQDSQWNVLDAAGATVLWTTNAGPVLSVVVPSGILTNSTTYKWQVRQSNGTLWSSYSSQTAFTTLAAPLPPNTPTQVAPAAGATGVSLVPTLQATYSDPAGLPLKSAEWAVVHATLPQYVWQGTNTALSITVPGSVLTNGTTYRWTVRYSNGFGWSPLTPYGTFTTIAAAVSTNTPLTGNWEFNGKIIFQGTLKPSSQ